MYGFGTGNPASPRASSRRPGLRDELALRLSTIAGRGHGPKKPKTDSRSVSSARNWQGRAATGSVSVRGENGDRERKAAIDRDSRRLGEPGLSRRPRGQAQGGASRKHRRQARGQIIERAHPKCGFAPTHGQLVSNKTTNKTSLHVLRTTFSSPQIFRDFLGGAYALGRGPGVHHMHRCVLAFGD